MWYRDKQGHVFEVTNKKLKHYFCDKCGKIYVIRGNKVNREVVALYQYNSKLYDYDSAFAKSARALIRYRQKKKREYVYWWNRTPERMLYNRERIKAIRGLFLLGLPIDPDKSKRKIPIDVKMGRAPKYKLH